MKTQTKIRRFDKTCAIVALLAYEELLDDLIDNTTNDERVWGAIDAREKFQECIDAVYKRRNKPNRGPYDVSS